MCDLDHFKAVNDTYGHQSGDAVLRKFSEILLSGLRQSIDSVVRYGGEEFLILLPNTDIAGAAQVAERLRAVVAQTTTASPRGQTIAATASFGVSGILFGHAHGPVSERTLIAAADVYLYEAKRAGRNTTRYGPPPSEKPDKNTANATANGG